MALPLHGRKITEVVADLALRVRRLERARLPGRTGVVSSGHRRLDHLLPEGGLRRGTLVEWLAAGAASGAGTLALIAARELARQGGAIVVIDRDRQFYPPGAIRLGIELEQLIVVRPAGDEDCAWAVDQVLRARGVAAVWCAVARQDDHTLRRWQLAAESSGAVGLLLRPAAVRHDPSWAELRLLVEPLVRTRRAGRQRQQRITLLRSRNGQAGRMIELELPTPDAQPYEQPASPARGRGPSDETRLMPVASPLAAAKARRRARRA
jgi:protein ImuA